MTESDLYRCRLCGHTSSNPSEMANCGNCGGIAQMIPNTPRTGPTATVPRDCPDAVIEAFAGSIPAADMVTIYAKIIRLAEVRK